MVALQHTMLQMEGKCILLSICFFAVNFSGCKLLGAGTVLYYLDVVFVKNWLSSLYAFEFLFVCLCFPVYACVCWFICFFCLSACLSF